MLFPSFRRVRLNHTTCWVSIGGDSRFILENLGNVAGLFDVTGQSDYPRSVVYLEQIMDAPSDDAIRRVAESARDEALMDRRRRNLVVDREPSFFLSWTGERRIALTSHGYHITEWCGFDTC